MENSNIYILKRLYYLRNRLTTTYHDSRRFRNIEWIFVFARAFHVQDNRTVYYTHNPVEARLYVDTCS